MQVSVECASSDQLRAWASNVSEMSCRVGTQATTVQGLGGKVSGKACATTWSSPSATRMKGAFGQVESGVDGAAGQLQALAGELRRLAAELSEAAIVAQAREQEAERRADQAEREARREAKQGRP